MGALLNFSTQIEFVNCYKCGVPTGLPQDHLARLRNNGKSFWCFNGHEQGWSDTEEKRLKRKLAQVESERDQARRDAEFQATQRESERKQAEKDRKRIHRRITAGMCPCCRRTFVRLARHIAHKHPDFKKDAK